MIGGHMGRVLFVDLGSGQIRAEEPDDSLYRDFLGGYGFGARVIYGQQPGGVDPLGADATLGFCTGVLVGSPAITPNRWTVVGKSPLTLGWGDANCGGQWGPMLKMAGFDAVFVQGIADRPAYLFVQEGEAELRDASDMWGVDALETELRLRERYPKSQSAVIGPAGEKLSLMSGVVNDEGRIAARSGLGAVMGSKRLKAIVARGTAPLPMADAARANEIRRRFIREMAANPKVKYFTKYGTINHTASSAFGGDSPIRNWGGSGLEDFPTAEKISDDTLLSYEYKKYACWKCNIACGGHYRTDDPLFSVAKTHKPEYESSALWGNNLLNDNIHSLMKANDLCNRYGLDTISTGSVIGFAIECFERGLISKVDTDGIELRWGDAAAIMALGEKIGKREGIGDVLADGVMRASQKIPGSEELAIHVGGQEPPAHDPRYAPSWGMIYAADATPGRHTQMAYWVQENGGVIPGVDLPKLEKYQYSGKGALNAKINNLGQAVFSAGVCMFAFTRVDFSAWTEMIEAVSGVETSVDSLDEIGARVAATRQAFTLREGVNPLKYHIPGRAYGYPPIDRGPLAGVVVDVETLRREFYEARGWDPETGTPHTETLERLGLEEMVPDMEACRAQLGAV
ncbi:MAG TPA: aldehyde ferredoxin oxidoreductase family protein [Chloroflexota bacterium]|nr:aldehyde ferredoxin oxidoreductase family protein [Chloroflexota bacterium]